jgi:glycosyltransferase involved in cell wall biosynthesis
MRSCLVITTYERADALGRVLESLSAQERWPDEVIVADDGSGPATALVIEAFARSSRVPVHHAWQAHEGFRAGRARNLAIARTRCDYVLLVDGDMVMHPRFVADHLDLARPGFFSQGTRINLGAAATAGLKLPGSRLPSAASRGLRGLRRFYALHAPRLARLLRSAANGFISVKACNQAFWRSDLLAVNGFDETLTGWGAEDKELCSRLVNTGVRRQTLLFAAIAFHLDHPPAARAMAEDNRLKWLETARSGRRRCEAGLDRHLA